MTPAVSWYNPCGGNLVGDALYIVAERTVEGIDTFVDGKAKGEST